jgi:opacity protein-like surface antigen
LRSANTVFGHHAGKTGWTAGGGVEAHLGGNWTGKIEYLYLDFGTVTSTTTNLLNSTPLACRCVRAWSIRSHAQE